MATTIKVPTAAGRAAWVACIAVGVLSFWLLGSPEFASGGWRLGVAGGAIVIGLAKFYRSSLIDVDCVPVSRLRPNEARFGAILNIARWVTITIGIIALASFVVALNYSSGSLEQPLILALGLTGLVCILLREALSAALARPPYVGSKDR